MTDPVVGGDGAQSPGSGASSAAGATSAASIVAAAERLAAEITRNAQAEADAIRARVGSESDAARSAINERLRHLSALADGMHERLGEMRAELDALSASLTGRDAPEAPAAAPAPPAAAALAEPPAAAAAAAAPEPSAAAETPEPPAGGVDDAGARLIALNLALSDTPRDEAARQRRGQVPEPERLVAEVYASVQH
jgi:translation initiation factor IF-2